MGRDFAQHQYETIKMQLICSKLVKLQQTKFCDLLWRGD